MDAKMFCIGPAAELNPEYASSFNDFTVVQDELTSLNGNQGYVLVTGTSWGNDDELKAIRKAGEHGEVSCSILDYWNNYRQRFSSNNSFIYPDHLIVMDEIARNEAIMDGIPPTVIQVLGHPGLDKFICKKLNSPTDIKNKALFLSQPLSQLYADSLGYTEQQVLRDVCELFEKYKDWELDVKFHPKESVLSSEAYRTVAGQLIELLPLYDLVIGMNTMGLLHARLMGGQIVSYQPNLVQQDVCITNKLGLSELLTSKEQLFDWFANAAVGRSESMKEDLLPQHGLPWMDGNSAERVGLFLQGLV